jgi:sterol desaturase/sphingolipid hydroxylase (fatty acid hydroxylase superfamily)
LGAALVRFAVPGSALAAAAAVEDRNWGLLHYLSVSREFAFVLAVVVLDIAIYLQHILFHAVPAFWRLHRVHHADLDCDTTTGLRFHPAEIVLSMAFKMGTVAALGAPVAAVLAFEILLNGTSLFNHSNLRLPTALDRLLRLVLVTPDMHRVHHSTEPQEMNSNFGFSFPWWDRLFATYRAQPLHGHEEMKLGIAQFRTEGDLRLDRMLVQPLRGSTGPS